jgi:L-arabinose isomerase
MSNSEIWFVTGSQHLYGDEVIRQVVKDSLQIAHALYAATLKLHAEVVHKPVLTDADAIRRLCLEAISDDRCAGLILWMHTFSPAKMWINGLKSMTKPVCHLHTQFNRDLPWSSIDMDFMNLNQSAHGDREAGHLHARLGLARKVIVGHWSDDGVQQEIVSWIRVALAWQDWQGAKFCRFGDNMREVAVTEGDKVAAEAQFGFSVNGYGVGDLVKVIKEVSDGEAESLCGEYEDLYNVDPRLQRSGDQRYALREAAKIELGILNFLHEGGFKGFTTTFEDLHGLNQLPGIAAQRLMAAGYGFAAEGDWKTAALLRAIKTMTDQQSGGTSFMEDYTYHLDAMKPQVLGAHMLEICPSIASQRPKVEIHPLGIGGKDAPVRLVFDAHPGDATNVSLIDLGHRFRLVVNEVHAVVPPELPKLPVARALWECKPSFKTAATAWIYAGGAHHTVYSYDATTTQLRDFGEIAGMEVVTIDSETKLQDFRNELRWNAAAFGQAPVRVSRP